MKLPVYLEIGAKRTFAAAVDWPGWSRSGADEAEALQALLDYGPRYAKAIASARLGFDQAANLAELRVVERLEGDRTTEFGTPGRIPKGDAKPVDEAELRRLQHLLEACWRTFEQAVNAAKGRRLRVGPRGGGRDLEKMVGHVSEAQHAYITMVGWNWKAPVEPGGSAKEAADQHETALRALRASAHGQLPTRGPRGGIRWPARYFVRREAWHVLDHAWEIEDRLDPGK